MELLWAIILLYRPFSLMLFQELCLHCNLFKCEIFLPSGDVSFPDFPPGIKKVGGLELSGFPFWGPDVFF